MDLHLDFGVRREEVYLDNAATTEMDQRVIDAMYPFLGERYGNPETTYWLGREAHDAVEQAREKVADVLGVSAREIFFTSGGTEANNWAIKGCQCPENKKKAVVCSVEHKSVLLSAQWRYRANTVAVDEDGLIDLNCLEDALKDGTGLVSVQYGNNEVGTMQPVVEIANLCRKYGAFFHCDAVQAFGKTPLKAEDIGADMISASAHKIHGPMGIGCLWIRKGLNIEPLLHGGAQEFGRRAGTHAVPQIVGFGKAAELSMDGLIVAEKRMCSMIDEAARDLVLIGAKRNGHPEKRLPHILSVTFPGTDAALICGIMGEKGICVSTGSACATREGPSHVLKAMGRKHEDCCSTIRISASRMTELTEVRLAVASLHGAIHEAKSRDVL